MRIDWLLIFLSLSAAIFGIFIQYGGGAGEGIAANLSTKSMIWVTIGVILMFAFAFLNYQVLGSYAYVLYGIIILLLVFTLIPGIGAKIKGARSWIRFFGFGFQPAEFAKIIFIIALSRYLATQETKISHMRDLAIPFAMTIVPVFLIAIQPDLGYSILFLPTLFAMLYFAGANTVVLSGVLVVGFLSLSIPMYLEYHKYIIVDELVLFLEKSNYKLSDAVNNLQFEVWYYAENASSFAKQKLTGHLAWAKKILIDKDNLAQFFTAAQKLRSENPIFLRDYLASDLSIILSFMIAFIISGGTYFVYHFYSKSPLLKNLFIIFLIAGLSLSSSFFIRKTINLKPHQVVRLVSFANPDKFHRGAGYQLRHSIMTVGSGQLTGKGWKEGNMTKGNTPFLPEWYNDFIFSSAGEQTGFLGALLVLLLLYGIVLRGIIISWQSKDTFGALLAGGISFLFFLHTTINTGITLGLFPVTGIPLLFVSYGGSSIIGSFIAVGILMNIHMRRYIN